MDKSLKSELRRPFHPSMITWRPGSVRKDKTKALGLAYADLRAYQNRLDELFGFDWTVSYTPWGERIICNLTICGVTRSSTGEPDSQSERSEIAGTATEAQAFKRACSMFGMGRYLYEFPSPWVEYDGERNQFTDKGLATLESIAKNHYAKWVPETQPEQEQVQEQQEEDFGMGFTWPTEEKELGVVAAAGDGDWVLPDWRRLLTYTRQLHKDSGDRHLSTASADGGQGQYGYLVGLLDTRYGKGSHRAILSLLCDAVVAHDTPPGGDLRVLIDWLKDPAQNKLKVSLLDALVSEFKKEWVV